MDLSYPYIFSTRGFFLHLSYLWRELWLSRPVYELDYRFLVRLDD